MKCKKIQTLLMTGYLDGEISAGVRQEVDGHLEGCPSCRQWKQAVHETNRLFREAAPLEPPSAVWHRIEALVNAERKPAWYEQILILLSDLRLSFSLNFPKPVLGAILSLVVVMAVIPFLPGNGNHRAARQYLGEQMIYFSPEEPQEPLDGEEETIGSSLEYFLMG